AVKFDYSLAYINLSNLLAQKGDMEGALAANQAFCRTRPNDPMAHYDLGRRLAHRRAYKEAEAAYRKAIELKPEYAEAHCNLGDVLGEEGQFAEALKERRIGHELGIKQKGWKYDSAGWIREAERMVKLEAKLP